MMAVVVVLAAAVLGITLWAVQNPEPCKTFWHNETGTYTYHGVLIQCIDGNVIGRAK